MKFRQLGKQLLEESPNVLNQLGKEHLGQLRASLDAVKRRHGFEAITENYEAETESQSTSDSRSGSDSTGSHLNDLDEKEEVICMIWSIC